MNLWFARGILLSWWLHTAEAAFACQNGSSADRGARCAPYIAVAKTAIAGREAAPHLPHLRNMGEPQDLQYIDSVLSGAPGATEKPQMHADRGHGRGASGQRGRGAGTGGGGASRSGNCSGATAEHDGARDPPSQRGALLERTKRAAALQLRVKQCLNPAA